MLNVDKFLKELYRYLRRPSGRAIDLKSTRKLAGSLTTPELGVKSDNVIFSTAGSSYYTKGYLLLAKELERRNIPFSFLFSSDPTASVLPPVEVGGIRIDHSLSIRGNRFEVSDGSEQLHFDWNVSLEDGRVEAFGSNFYDVIVATLRTHQKRYNVDFQDAKSEVTQMIRSCDSQLAVFNRLLEVADANSCRIVIVGWESSYVPNGVWRFLCHQHGASGLLEYADVGRGYMHYFGQHFRESWWASSNLMRSGNSSRLEINEEEFSRLCAEDKSKHLATQRLNSNFVSRGSLEESDNVSYGKPFFVLFSHLFYDVPVCDDSNSFSNMCDWIQNTIDYFADTGQLLLLKPHPGEVRPEYPGKEPNERLEDFVDVEAHDNVHLLKPRDYTLGDLAPGMIAGLVWRSTAALELALLGVPAIVCGRAPYRCLGFPRPKSATEYFSMIDEAAAYEVPSDLQAKVARYLYFLKERKHHQLAALPYDEDANQHPIDFSGVDRIERGEDGAVQALVSTILGINESLVPNRVEAGAVVGDSESHGVKSDG